MAITFQTVMERVRRDIALRSGLISATTTLVALMLLSAVFWNVLIDGLEERVAESLLARHEVAARNTNVLSDEDRELIRRFRRSLPIRDEGAFAWVDSSGNTLSGNVDGLDCRKDFYKGWLDVSQSAVEQPVTLIPEDSVDRSKADRFMFLARQRGENCLVFGSSLHEVDKLRSGVLGLLGWLIPVCLLPAVFIGLYQSFKLRSRLRRLGTVVKQVSSGELDVRMPIAGDDDIDRLALSTNRSLDRLQESVGTLQQLTSVMAHDLRAPLSRVAVPLDEAIRANQIGQPAVEPLEEVKLGLADARSIFDALLRITQIESGRRRSKFTDVDLFELAEGLYEIYQPVCEDADRTLELEITGHGASVVHGDADLLRQAAVNLIENATRYSRENAYIRICLVRDLDAPQLIVKDDGPGLPAEERPRVLQRLYRYEASTRGQGGHGLGLSLVKAVIDVHDGEISLEDAEPGLLVRMTFKASPVASTDALESGEAIQDGHQASIASHSTDGVMSSRSGNVASSDKGA